MNARNTLFWNQDTTNTEGRALNAIFQTYNYDEMIHEPTRIVGNTKSCIDLMFTNNPFLFTEIGTRDKIVEICDHHPIFATLKYTLKKPKCYSRWVWDFKRGDFEKFRSLLLEAPWYECYEQNNSNISARKWVELFMYCAEQSVPHYEAIIRPNDKDFMNSSLRNLMRKKDRLREQFKNSHKESIAKEYRHLRNMVISETRKAKYLNDNKRDQEINEIDTTSRKWWKGFKRELGNSKSSNDGPLLHNGKLITDGDMKTNLHNDFFISQTSLDLSTAQLPIEPPTRQHSIPQPVIQPVDVYEILISLDPNKATGPDGIGNRLLKESAVPIASPMSHLFNFCLSLGHFPDCWKVANVIPVYKKNDPLLCTNYRPISLLPCISKVFEKLLFNHIFSFLKTHNLISKRQSGFTPGDSAVNQLIAICNNLYKCIDSGDEMIGVFLDLTKAFDKVWHAGLLYKMQCIGISGKRLEILKSYLTERKQRVVLNGHKSEIKTLQAGVPQGSVLGPLLFLIFINDISEDLSSESFLFADDTSLFEHIVNNNIQIAAQKINCDLEIINKWAKRWLLIINPSKTVVMLFSRKRSPSQLPAFLLGDYVLTSVKAHKHLGLILTSSLSWSEHIDSVISKSNQILGMTKRFKYKWSRMTLEVCYISFIRPILEYGNIIYDSCTQHDSNRLEAIQLDAARTITGAKRGTSHEALYNELGWHTLSERRYAAKLVKMYGICNKLTPQYLADIFNDFAPDPSRLTRAQHRYDFKIPRCNTTFYQNSFVISTMALWNNTEITLRQKSSQASFKQHVLTQNKINPYLFNHKTSRPNQVSFMQLRLGFSNLNDHLFLKGCVENRSCSCGFEKEDTKHFLLHCNLYQQIRFKLVNDISCINNSVNLSANVLLKGSPALSNEDNMSIFNCVYNFLQESKRLYYTS